MADIGEYAMLMVAWHSVHQMAMPTTERCEPRIARDKPPVTRPMRTVTDLLSAATHRSETAPATTLTIIAARAPRPVTMPRPSALPADPVSASIIRGRTFCIGAKSATLVPK
jgi:hypothetical protein